MDKLQSFRYQIFLYERDIVAFEHDLSIHLINSRENSLLSFLLDQFMKLLIELPYVTLNVLQNRSTTEPVIFDLQIHWHHEVLASRNKIRQILVLFWIGRRPARRIFRLD